MYVCMYVCTYVSVRNAKNRLSRINFPNNPHILSPVPNRKRRLGANLYQPLVVGICQNTCSHVTKCCNFCKSIPFLTIPIYNVHQ